MLAACTTIEKQKLQNPSPIQTIETLVPTPAPVIEVPRPANTPEPTPIPAPVMDFDKIKPNELGDMMMLEYHHIGDEELRWTRSRDNFRRDLHTLYDRGYRIIGVHDFLDNKINVPAGLKPIMVVFDDSNASQFRYLERQDGSLEIDPGCAVGIMENFYNTHPDFGRGVGFGILPQADSPNKFFNQPEYTAEKVKFLLQNGYELYNHTWYHVDLSEAGDDTIVSQVANGAREIEELARRFVPDYRVRVLVLPMGGYPRNRSFALSGVYKGFEYNMEAFLEVAGGAVYAPDHKLFDPLHFPRIQATEPFFDDFLRYYDNHPEEHYVSDGNPDTVTFPLSYERFFNPRSRYQELPSAHQSYKIFRIR